MLRYPRKSDTGAGCATDHHPTRNTPPTTVAVAMRRVARCVCVTAGIVCMAGPRSTPLAMATRNGNAVSPTGTRRRRQVSSMGPALPTTSFAGGRFPESNCRLSARSYVDRLPPDFLLSGRVVRPRSHSFARTGGINARFSLAASVAEARYRRAHHGGRRGRERQCGCVREAERAPEVGEPESHRCPRPGDGEHRRHGRADLHDAGRQLRLPQCAHVELERRDASTEPG